MRAWWAVGALMIVTVTVLVAPSRGWIPGAGADRSDSAESVERQGEILEVIRERLSGDAPDPALVDWYGQGSAELLWLDGSRPGDRGDDLLEALRAVEAEGIDPASLGAPGVAEEWERSRRRNLDVEAAASLELALSTAFVELSRTLLQGSDPEGEQSVDWDLDRDEDPGTRVLRSLAGGSVEGVLEGLRPTLEVYGATVEALAAYTARRSEGGGWPRVTGLDEAAAPGDTRPVVADVRERLRQGMDPVEQRLAASGSGDPQRLDPDLAAALAHFQGRHGIAVDSVIGPETVQAMNVPLEQRIQELRLNLDRIRRLPRDFGERAVLVNIAGFELRVLEENETALSMAVVVGQPSWRTTVFREEIDHLVVNPYWHVPESIEQEEILPRLEEDPGYLARQHMSLVPRADNFGDPVPSDTVDWSRVDPEDFPYDFRQEPGPWNALGRVKFMFPNPHNIYLHDTPADQLFERDFRAFSHGCVRVERPMELAHYLLETSSGTEPEEFDRILASGDWTRIDLEDPVPVYLAYLTTWVEDGTVSFHQDIYNFDEAALP